MPAWRWAAGASIRTSAGGAAYRQMIQRNLLRDAAPGEASRAGALAALAGPADRWRAVSRGFKVPVWSVAAIAAVAAARRSISSSGRCSRRQCRRPPRRGCSRSTPRASSASCAGSSRPRRHRRLPRPQPPKVCGAVQPPIVCLVTPNVIVGAGLVGTSPCSSRDRLPCPRRVPAADRARSPACSTQEGGAIKVVGHTDNVPIRTARLPLECRAARRRGQGGGRGAENQAQSSRIASASRARAPTRRSRPTRRRRTRAKNRRVEILIQRTREELRGGRSMTNDEPRHLARASPPS